MKNRIIALLLAFIMCITVILQPKEVKAEAVLGSMLLYGLGAGLLASAGYIFSDKEATAEVVEGFWDYVTPKTDYDGVFLKTFGHLSEKELLKISQENQWDLKIKEMSTNKERKIRTTIGDSFKDKVDEYINSLPDKVEVPAHTGWVQNPKGLENCDWPSCYYPGNVTYCKFSITTAGTIRLGVSNGGWGSYNTLSLDVGDYTLSTTNNKRHELRTANGTFITAYAWTSSIYENYPDSDAYKMTCYGLTAPFGSTAEFGYIDFWTYVPETTTDNEYKVPFNTPVNQQAWDDTGAIDIPYTPSLDKPYSPENVNAWEQEVPIEYPYVRDIANEVDIPWVETLTEEQVMEQEQEVPQEGVEDIILPMTPIYESSGKLTDKFPFCIPFDLVRSVQSFSSTTNTKIEFDVPIVQYPLHFCLDFSDYEVLVIIFRFFSLLMFIISMMILTRNIIRG